MYLKLVQDPSEEDGSYKVLLGLYNKGGNFNGRRYKYLRPTLVSYRRREKRRRQQHLGGGSGGAEQEVEVVYDEIHWQLVAHLNAVQGEGQGQGEGKKKSEEDANEAIYGSEDGSVVVWRRARSMRRIRNEGVEVGDSASTAEATAEADSPLVVAPASRSTSGVSAASASSDATVAEWTSGTSSASAARAPPSAISGSGPGVGFGSAPA